MHRVILASTSRYRAELLTRITTDFEQIAPECDETPMPGESPKQLVRRLSHEKAASIATKHPQALVIGSDQVAACDGKIIGKPADHNAAVNQLHWLSGKSVLFHTGLCVAHHATHRKLEHIVNTEAIFKTLEHDVIGRYLNADKPYDCAASFRSEGMGSAIVESLSSEDPTAIIGLPLITVAACLNQLGLSLP